MLNNVPKLKLILFMLCVMTSHDFHISITNWHKSIANSWTTKAFAICPYGGWTPCCYSFWPWPPTTPERVQGGVRHSVLQGIWWDRYLDNWMILWSQCLHLFISREALSIKSLHGDLRSSWLTNNLLWNECFMVLTPFTKTLYIDFNPLPLWSSLSELYEMLPPGCSPNFAPNRT